MLPDKAFVVLPATRPREDLMNRNSGLPRLFVILLAFIVIVFTTSVGVASEYKVLYSFKGGSDGIGPTGLALDPAGNLFGSTDVGGGGSCTDYGCGTIFQLTNSKGKWSEKVLFRFEGTKGRFPDSGVIIDAEGNLYGTTSGHYGGNGIAFKLTPGANGNWNMSVLHVFAGGDDGLTPYGGLIQDTNGNLYGTTQLGGGSTSCSQGCGIVYELSPPRIEGGGWKEAILHRFDGTPDGAGPVATLTFDAAGNLFGTTAGGGAYGGGTVFRLARTSDGKWTEDVLHSFNGTIDGAEPFSSLVFDAQGNLFGTTYAGTASTRGSVVELIPVVHGWKERVIHVFRGGRDGGNPYSGLIADKSGILYGTTSDALTGGNGTVFKLTRGPKGVWTKTTVHKFTGGRDGGFPAAPLVMDSAGNLYGTTGGGGKLGWGVVFEIAP